jgi:hypothetical protein
MPRPFVQASAITCMGVWIKFSLILADAVSSWRHVEVAFQTMATWRR